MEIEIESLPEQQNQPQQKKFLQKLESGEHEIPTGFLKDAVQTLGRLPARAIETVAGFPADIANFAGEVANFPLNLVGLGVTPEEKAIIRKNQREGLGALPTSQELKEESARTAPWSKSEPGSYSEKAERATEILTSLALGNALGAAGKAVLASEVLPTIGKAAQTAFSSGLKKDAAKVLGSEMAGWLTHQFGGSEETEAKVRMGTLLLSQLAGGRQKVREAANTAYNDARNMAEGSERVNALGFQKHIGNQLNRLKEGKPNDVKAWAKNEYTILQKKLNGTFEAPNEFTTTPSKIKNGTFGVNDAVQYVQDLRKDLREGTVPFAAKHYAYDIIDSLKKNVINPYEKINPQFAKTFNAAEEAWSALHKEGLFSNFVREHFVNKPWASKIAGSLLGTAAASAAHAGGIAHALPFAGAALSGREAYRFLDLLKKSSIARDTYGKLFKAAANGNIAAASKLATRFDQAAKQYENKYPEEEEMIEIESL